METGFSVCYTDEGSIYLSCPTKVDGKEFEAEFIFSIESAEELIDALQLSIKEVRKGLS